MHIRTGPMRRNCISQNASPAAVHAGSGSSKVDQDFLECVAQEREATNSFSPYDRSSPPKCIRAMDAGLCLFAAFYCSSPPVSQGMLTLQIGSTLATLGGQSG